MSIRNHVVITGTGRSGTTFLVSLLTFLGLDTGFSEDDVRSTTESVGRAGLEFDIRRDNCPYVVKSPWFCDHAEEAIARPDIAIDHVLIPMRDLNAAAQSRRFVQSSAVAGMPFVRRIKNLINPNKVAGGVWHTGSMRAGGQEAVLLRQIYKLVLTLSDTDVPVTLLRYPRIVKDSPYLYSKLQPILKGIDYEAFHEAFLKVVRPNLVNSFNEADR
jgi:hypothetical protein